MYGLLGKTLSHSHSKSIHEAIRPMDYRLFESDDLDTFFIKTPFQGINVTIPYKEAVLDYCDILDDSVKKTQTVNTIITRAGLRFAYNTDYEALKILLHSRLNPNDNHAFAILGNGSTMRSVKEALRTLGYEDITIYARHPKENEYPFKAIKPHHTCLINTTPVGMAPNTSATLPIDIDVFPNLMLVFDVIYNPIRTQLLLDAEERNIPTMNGLQMLVLQAYLSNQLFFNTTYPLDTVKTIYKTIFLNTTNLTFIGLPFSGKTTYAKHLGNRLNKSFIDIDRHIEKTEKKTVQAIFNTDGEAHFRQLEHDAIIDISQAHNTIISPGGGIVMNERAMRAIKQNSLVLYLNLHDPLMRTIRFHSRPHVKTKDDLVALKEIRHPLYLKYADMIIEKDTLDYDVITERIEVEIHDYINHQWTELKSPRNT